jgi:hypothetical protein
MTKITIRDEATKVELEAEFAPKQQIQPGQKVRIIENPDGSLVLRIGRDWRELVGMLDGNGIHLTIEEINEGIAKGGAGL